MELHLKALELSHRKERYIYYLEAMKLDLIKEHIKPYTQAFLFATEQEWKNNIARWQHKINKINVKLSYIKSLLC